MVAYAIRYDVDNIVLMYPDTISGDILESKRLIIENTMANSREINIWIHQVPIINRDLFQAGAVLNKPYLELFTKTREKLKESISAIHPHLNDPSFSGTEYGLKATSQRYASGSEK